MGRWRGTGKVAWALILLAASARAQNTTPASVGTEAGLSDLLAARFYLHESYTRDEAPRVGSSEIGGYRVGLRERLVSTRENRQAAPKVEEQISQVFYSERPAAMSPIDGRVTAAIRQYEGAKITPTLPGEKQGLFQGLTIWYQARNGEPPLVIVQNEGRAIQDREYRMASRQLFVPNLALALPEKAIQVGDKYNLSPAGVSTLTGVPAQGGLSGTLQSVQPEEAGSRFRIAVLDIVGDARLPLGQAGVHAQIRFRFEPAVPSGISPRDETAPTMFDALGQIVKLTLAQEVVIPGGQEGRLTQMIRRELVLERKFDGVAKLTIPDPPPTPTSANSWLTYRDPKDRFTMRFPQEYQAQPSEDPDTILLGHATPLGPDLISVSTRTLSQQNVDQLRSGRIAAWRADKINVADNQVSPSRKLPAADWDSRKWDVYRFDAVLPLGGSPSSPNSRAKLYFFGYMILTGRGPGFYVEATTPQEPPGNFYLQVEEVLKTIAISGEVGATTRAGAP